MRALFHHTKIAIPSLKIDAHVSFHINYYETIESKFYQTEVLDIKEGLVLRRANAGSTQQ